ncbi:MAG: BatD family protein, partial [Planctomycetota bacterium]
MMRRRAAVRGVFCVLGALGVLLLSAEADGQDVRLRAGGGPYYTGLPIPIEVIARGFEGGGEPTCEAAAKPEEGRLTFQDVRRSHRDSVQIVNGRVSRNRETTYSFIFRYVGSRPGPVRIGPFVVRQGNRRAHTRAITFDLEEIPVTDEVRVRLILPERPLVIGQKVAVRLECWFSPRLEESLQERTITVPLFDLTDSFAFEDEPLARGTRSLPVETAAGTIRLAYRLEERDWKGEPYYVVTMERTCVPLAAGEYELEPAAIHVVEGTRWRRDLFGDRQAVATRMLRAADGPRRVVVRPLPAGAPESFAGAIGSGFTLEVSADRTVVRAGDPIALTLTLRGDGNLEKAGLPPLSAAGGLSPAHFRLPRAKIGGLLADGPTRCTVSVRVLDDSVREIPAIAYSWFSPELEEYQTTRSRPIALRVKRGEVVGAAEVVRAEPAEGDPGSENLLERGGEEGEAPGVAAVRSSRPRFSFTGADLSIVTDPQVVLADGRGSFGGWRTLAALYGAPLLLIALAVIGRLRAAVDPEVVRRRRALRRARRRIEGAERLPHAEGVAEVARALRGLIAEVPAGRSREVEAFIARCDAIT